MKLYISKTKLAGAIMFALCIFMVSIIGSFVVMAIVEKGLK